MNKPSALWEANTDLAQNWQSLYVGVLPYRLLVQDFQKLLFLLAFPVSQAALCLQGHQGVQEDPKE